jgi:DNA-directed RNA polymerase subunit RPC12/RpoP
MKSTNTVTCRHCGQEMKVDANSLGREIACDHCGNSTLIAAAAPASNAPSGTEVYNIVSDTVTGINVRWKDNLIQFAVIVACVPIGALIGAVAMDDWRPGVVIGGFGGLMVGFFGSGTFLMIYRFIRHARRDHR